MSYLYRTGNSRNNIAFTNTANSSTRYLRRTSTGRNNIAWSTIPNGSTYNILQRNGTGRNNILWSNLKIEFMSYLAPRYYDTNNNKETSSRLTIHRSDNRGVDRAFWGNRSYDYSGTYMIQSGQAINNINDICLTMSNPQITETTNVTVSTLQAFKDYTIFNRRLKFLFNDMGWQIITTGLQSGVSSHQYQVRLIVESINFGPTEWNNKFEDKRLYTHLSILY